MSRYHNYDPDAMFPRKPKVRRFWTGERVARWLIIIGLSAFAIFVGAGCGSVRNIKEVDFGITGLEMEFYPNHPSQEEKSIFDFSTITNRVRAVPVDWDAPAGWDGPVLMPMKKRK